MLKLQVVDSEWLGVGPLFVDIGHNHTGQVQWVRYFLVSVRYAVRKKRI